jgi:S1-C subfamily serine protease
MHRPLFSLLLAAALGGGVSAAVLIAAGHVGGTTTTVVQQVPLAQSAALARESDGMTPREIYKRDAPGVVYVRARSVQAGSSPFDVFPAAQENVSTGSGFVLDDEGHILTNDHVVAGATDVRVSFSERTVAARVVGKDPDTDIAVLAVDPDAVDLRPLELGDSATVAVGDPTIAIGNPFGLDRTLTTGVVSALQRRIEAPSGFAIEDVIQTDAAINPGNSGGPLLDATGRVIGINSQIATASGGDGNVGIAFAVPINTAKAVVPELLATGRVTRPFLGVQGRDVGDGILLSVVAPGSPADAAGLRGGVREGVAAGELVLLGGDVLVSVGGRRVRSVLDVPSALAGHEPGEEVVVTFLRDGRRGRATVRLGERPAGTALL